MRRLAPAAAVTAFCLLSTSPALSAQDIGGGMVRATSANAELPSPQGFGLHATFRASSVRFGLSYARFSDDTEKRGVVCQVYSPRIGCRTEGVNTSARMSGLRVTVLPMLEVGELLDVGVGGGLSFNQVDAESLGESGFRADLHLPNSGQIGYLGVVAASLSPLPSVPLKLVAELTGHWIDFKGCVDPSDPTSGYAPFCGWDRFTELRAGVSVALPRQDLGGGL